jgi:hypothetical protein
MHAALPKLHELGEILVDDLGAVEALVAGGDRRGGHDGGVLGKDVPSSGTEWEIIDGRG